MVGFFPDDPTEVKVSQKMRNPSLALIFGALTCLVLAQSSSPLTLTRTVPLPGVGGKFDHFAYDVAGHRLFAAATGNHSVEVIDLQSGKVTQSITGLGKPHGLVWSAETDQLYVSDGTQADLKVYHGTPLKQVADVKLSDDADDMIYGATTRRLYVGHGADSGNVAVIDTNSTRLIANLPVSAHPEGLDIDDKSNRIFSNIADSAEVAVIDGRTLTISATWKLTRAKDNVPVAYDADDKVLFVACRTPGRLLMLDGASGKELADLPASGGVDDLFYDSSLHRIYLIAGSSAVDIYEIDAGKTVRSLGSTLTLNGAKTGLFIPSLHMLAVGVPGTTGRPAEIRLYSTGATVAR